ncbi:type II toxin-antitoxin system HicB family antitoxin [Pseudomonas sp. B21-051]|uniref:type II toxin-antitoxin system HicB family antitoxin n=1 Tax=Pseudomonas sp. B21-051 TaxID=2895491 RepID=UPI00215E1938|nr:type II toxin-antitoxin system HicB family antitoxin [Pseudomonas sp. B21-051]UVK89777.1 type II toxin-antitoxin system HicB family antitoxin [Pseudomonas sp. B21-051]
MRLMSYNGYVARYEYSNADGLFVGHISGIKGIVGFHGDSVNELLAAFEEAVTDYLNTLEACSGMESQS